MTSMIEHQIRRREELRINPRDVATPVPTGGQGSRGNTGHLNLDRPLPASPTGTKKMANYRARVAALAAKRQKRKAAEAKRKPLSQYRKDIITARVRMAAYIRELASLGRFPREIAALLKLSEVTTYKRMRQFNIKASGRESYLRQMVRQWYGIKSPDEIAEMVGTTRKTVGVIAHVLGVTGRRSDPAKFRRGFIVPDDRWEEYIAYRREFKNRITAEEIGMVMGLVPRPTLAPRIVPRYAGAEEAHRP